MAGLAITGCDQGEPLLDEGVGPDLLVVAAHPKPGAGLECEPASDPSCGVPVTTSIQLRFNRYLLPSTAVRQSLRLYLADPEPDVLLLKPHYDVVERVIEYRLPGYALREGAVYTVDLPVPEEDDDWGFRAFDGAPIAEGAIPLTYSFRTQRQPSEPPEPLADTPSCAEVLAVFASSCGSNGCHAGTNELPPPMGLNLESREALLRTAIDRVAHQTEIGATAGDPLEAPARLGVQMPIIDPGRPGNSYLMYKLLRKPENFTAAPPPPPPPPPPNATDPGPGPSQPTQRPLSAHTPACTTRYAVDLAGQCPLAPAAERERLREWFVRMSPMPASEEKSLHQGQLRLVQAWIAGGAPVDDCQ